MKKNGFTIIEVSILCLIFLIVFFLMVPLSLNDTSRARNTSKWRNVQPDFSNIFYTVNTYNNGKEDVSDFKTAFEKILSGDIKSDTDTYRITYMNGTYPSDTYRFKDFKTTYANATLAYKIFDNPQDNLLGILMYDVNGKQKPNVWGNDVFGLNIYKDRFEPFCRTDSVSEQKQDCSRNGTGLCCSNYYLIGGSFD